MKERIRQQLGEEPSGLWAGTFHSIGARILRRFASQLGWSSTFTIYDQDQSLRQIKRAQEEAGIDPKRWSPKVFRAHISGAKNQLISPQGFLDENGDSFDILLRNVARVYPVYQQALRNHDAFDFDDLLMKPVELLESNPEILEDYRSRFSFLLVDEYQDTNRAQFRFLELLAGEVGEPHGRGGRRPEHLWVERGRHPEHPGFRSVAFPSARVVRLEQNYRSTAEDPGGGQPGHPAQCGPEGEEPSGPNGRAGKSSR